MIERALIHVAGPPGAGKTTFLEKLLGSIAGPVICVRGERDDRLAEPRESSEHVLGTLGRRRRAASRTAEWTIAASHRGIENARLVVVNLRGGQDRASAERLVEEIARLRSDDELRVALLGRFAHRLPITAVVADVTNPKDAGMKKAVARVKRAVTQRTARY